MYYCRSGCVSLEWTKPINWLHWGKERDYERYTRPPRKHQPLQSGVFALLLLGEYPAGKHSPSLCFTLGTLSEASVYNLPSLPEQPAGYLKLFSPPLPSFLSLSPPQLSLPSLPPSSHRLLPVLPVVSFLLLHFLGQFFPSSLGTVYGNFWDYSLGVATADVADILKYSRKHYSVSFCYRLLKIYFTFIKSDHKAMEFRYPVFNIFYITVTC